MPRIRAFILKLHLWLGLGIGALFVLLGLTGSALVFYEGLDAALHPAIRVAATGPAPGWDSPVWDRALATVRSRWPERTGAWRFEASGEPGALAARYQPPGGRPPWPARDGVALARGHRAAARGRVGAAT